MAITAHDFEAIRTFVRTRSAISLDPGKEYLVESRLAPLAAQEGLPSLHALIEAIGKASNRSLGDKVVDAMTTNEGSFFRDVEPFNVLRKEVLPALLVERAGERRLNFWCGAASTGQEPYTVAMILREHFPQLATWDVTFLATDLSPTVLAKAKAGRFAQLEVNRGLPATFLGNQRLDPPDDPVRADESHRHVASHAQTRHRLPAERAHLLRHRRQEEHPGAPGRAASPGWLPVSGRR
jgi:chemotaxis protein methyltransferase CheR